MTDDVLTLIETIKAQGDGTTLIAAPGKLLNWSGLPRRSIGPALQSARKQGLLTITPEGEGKARYELIGGER